MRKLYRFIGDTEQGRGFQKGWTYELKVRRPSRMQRLLSGHPDWRVIVTAPFFCPYASELAFAANWEEVDQNAMSWLESPIGVSGHRSNCAIYRKPTPSGAMWVCDCHLKAPVIVRVGDE